MGRRVAAAALLLAQVFDAAPPSLNDPMRDLRVRLERIKLDPVREGADGDEAQRDLLGEEGGRGSSSHRHAHEGRFRKPPLVRDLGSKYELGDSGTL